MKMIVGLGNPGKKYEKTRHNFGFMVVDMLAQHFKIDFKDSKHRGLIAELPDQTHHKIFLVKPSTFMNLSGECVGPFAKFYKISPEDILVIYDDLDLPLAKIRFAKQGGSAGHNGIKSLLQTFGDSHFMRLRLGIGRPKHPEHAVSDYVLQNFSSEESKLISSQMPVMKEAIEFYLQNCIEKTMNRYN